LQEIEPGHLVSCHRAAELELVGIGDAEILTPGEKALTP
jgi:hypothetical protein